MSKISLQPNASGAGTFSIVAPDSNTNRTLTLPDESGTVFSDGTGVPGSALTGQLASSNMPAGSVIQVVQSTTTTETTVTSTSYVDVSGLSASITPTSTNNKILVMCYPNGRLRNKTTDFRNYFLRITRNGTEVFDGVSRDISAALGVGSNHVGNGNMNLMFLDLPNTTLSTEYKIQAKIDNAANTTQYNFNSGGQGTASLILMEIAG